MRIVKGKNLAPGMVLALPFNKQATIQSVKRGTTFMHFVTEHGQSRMGLEDEVLIETQASTLTLSAEEIDALIYVCEDAGEMYMEELDSDHEDAPIIREIGNVLVLAILPKLKNLKEHTT